MSIFCSYKSNNLDGKMNQFENVFFSYCWMPWDTFLFVISQDLSAIDVKVQQYFSKRRHYDS